MTKKEKQERAKKLDLAIHEGIKKFKIVLTPGTYMALEDGDVCGCAIGSAIMATAKSKPALDKLMEQFETVDDNAKYALDIINAGITAEDLRDLEAGFECWKGYDAKHAGLFAYSAKGTVDKESPFYKLGQKLRVEQIKKQAERDLKEVQAEAEQVLADAKYEAAQILKEANVSISKELKSLGLA